jgi:hypothetical protein
LKNIEDGVLLLYLCHPIEIHGVLGIVNLTKPPFHGVGKVEKLQTPSLDRDATFVPRFWRNVKA